jgi:hypothetical protein
MNSSTSESGATERKDRGVLCAKCEHLNAWGRNECKRCGAHLYISCSDCGQRNERVRTRCANCQRRLHYSIFERARRRLSNGAIQWNSLQVVLFCIGVALAFVLIFFFSRLHLPGVF